MTIPKKEIKSVSTNKRLTVIEYSTSKTLNSTTGRLFQSLKVVSIAHSISRNISRRFLFLSIRWYSHAEPNTQFSIELDFAARKPAFYPSLLPHFAFQWWRIESQRLMRGEMYPFNSWMYAKMNSWFNLC